MSVVNFSHPNKDKHKAQGPRGGCDCSASSRQTKDVYLISHLMRSSLGSSLTGVKSKPTILAPVSLITYNNIQNNDIRNIHQILIFTVNCGTTRNNFQLYRHYSLRNKFKRRLNICSLVFFCPCC